jgi:broad specificity phosphatase PhoE
VFGGLVGFAGIAVIAPASAAEPGPRTVVYVVRHAEKAGEPRRNPGLTRSGAERAAALAAVLAGTELTGIITSQFARTKATAAPVAKATGVEPVVIRYRPGAWATRGARSTATSRRLTKAASRR